MKKKARRDLVVLFACILLTTIHFNIISYGTETEDESETSENTEEIALKVNERQYTILEPDETAVFPKDVKQVTVMIDGQMTYGYVQGDDYNFCLLYGMNEEGEKSVYRYDLKEKTMQRYTDAVSGQSYEKMSDQYNQLIEDYQSQKKENSILYVILGAFLLGEFLH